MRGLRNEQKIVHNFEKVPFQPLLRGEKHVLPGLESAAAAAVLVLLGEQAEELGESQADAWTQGAS